jgi:hypothetical protein
MPPGLLPLFARVATASFCAFALLGLFTSLAPSLLANEAGVSDHAVAGWSRRWRWHPRPSPSSSCGRCPTEPQ